MSVLLYILSVNLDSIGVGISYGARKIHISRAALFIIAVFSVFCSSLALLFGSVMGNFLTPTIGKLLGSTILLFLGFWILFSAFKEHNKSNQVKEHTFSIKTLGITISIIHNPSLCDFDDSSRIDGKEALFLALGLSLDSIAISIGAGISGHLSWFLPLLIGISQFIFLEFGRYLGAKLADKFKVSHKIWTIFAGIALIIFAIIG